MAQITYDDKVYLNENASVPAINKVQASDMNEIKNVVNANDDKFNYTQEEQTIGTWIDGKPIYRKVVVLTSFTTGETVINHNISNIDKVINVSGFALRRSGECEMLPTIVPPNIQSDFQISIYDINNTRFRMYLGRYTTVSNTALTNMYIIFEYTKTTD